MRCIMDFPAAWAFTEASKDEDHDPKCSWIRARMLCDCPVIWNEYTKRKAARAALARHTSSPQGEQR